MASSSLLGVSKWLPKVVVSVTFLLTRWDYDTPKKLTPHFKLLFLTVKLPHYLKERKE